MNKEVPTVEETWFKNTGSSINQEEYAAMIEFAKLHVEAALKAATNNAKMDSDPFDYEDEWIDKDSILNAYPLENIK